MKGVERAEFCRGRLVCVVVKEVLDHSVSFTLISGVQRDSTAIEGTIINSMATETGNSPTTKKRKTGTASNCG